MTVFADVVVLASIVLSILLTIQSAYTLYLMLYTWDRPEAHARAKAPSSAHPTSRSRSCCRRATRRT